MVRDSDRLPTEPLERELSVLCPTCFESVAIVVERTAEEVQNFSYDCPVCCRPMAVKVEFFDGEAAVSVDPE